MCNWLDVLLFITVRFAPSARWQVETLITMLSIAGNHCDDSISCMTVSHVTKLEELHSFATHKLFRLLRDELPRVQVALMHVAIWCIGEYGDHLLVSCDIGTASDTEELCHAVPVPEILGLLEVVIKSHLATELTKSYVLTALMKLSKHLSEGHMEIVSLITCYSVMITTC